MFSGCTSVCACVLARSILRLVCRRPVVFPYFVDVVEVWSTRESRDRGDCRCALWHPRTARSSTRCAALRRTWTTTTTTGTTGASRGRSSTRATATPTPSSGTPVRRGGRAARRRRAATASRRRRSRRWRRREWRRCRRRATPTRSRTRSTAPPSISSSTDELYVVVHQWRRNRAASARGRNQGCVSAPILLVSQHWRWPQLELRRRQLYDRYLLPAPRLRQVADIDRKPVSSKPAARRCCCRSTGQTDRWTDGHPTVTQTFTAYYAASVNNPEEVVALILLLRD